jgi:hypothetical protein
VWRPLQMQVSTTNTAAAAADDAGLLQLDGLSS